MWLSVKATFCVLLIFSSSEYSAVDICRVLRQLRSTCHVFNGGYFYNAVVGGCKRICRLPPRWAMGNIGYGKLCLQFLIQNCTVIQ